MWQAVKSFRSVQTHQGESRHTLQCGQSLVEVSLTITVLLLIFSGVVDLGRAFFVKVALDSVISEGAHWAAAYPDCIATAYNVTSAAQVPAKCRGTNSILGRMINENQDLNSARIVALTVTPTTAQPGDTITINVIYQLDTLTPIIQALFGKSLLISTQVKEVVRGTGMPPQDGVAMTNNGGVAPVQPLAGVQQAPATCNNGVATLSWTAVSASGYHLWKGNVSSSPYPSPVDYTVTPGGTIGATLTWNYAVSANISTTGTGGSQTFTVTSYNDNGSVYNALPPVTVAASCSDIVPAIQTYTCPPGGAYDSGMFFWTMPSPIDLTVTGYRIYRVDAGNVYTAMLPDVTGGATSSGTIAFTSATDRTKPYAVRALNGSTAIGAFSAEVTIDCSPGSGLTGNYFNNASLSGSPALTRVDPTVNFNWGSLSPDVSIAPDHFSVRWTGQVRPLYSELYTFYTLSDDGVRLWVNGQLVVDNWTDHWATENSGQILLNAGQRYDIKMEFYENLGQAVAGLSWSSASQSKVVIPSTQLYP